MFKLPKIPYTMDKDQNMEIPFRGINFSDRLSDGDIADSFGISMRRYPFVTNKRGRGKIYSELEHVAVHDGTYICYEKGGLIYCAQNVETWNGQYNRHFANINSKTVVMPDKKYIEFNVAEGEYPQLCQLEATTKITAPRFDKNALHGEYQKVVDLYNINFKAEEGSFSGNPVILFGPGLFDIKMYVSDISVFLIVTESEKNFWGFEEDKLLCIVSEKYGTFFAKVQYVENRGVTDHYNIQYNIYIKLEDGHSIETNVVDLYTFEEVELGGYIDKNMVIMFEGTENNDKAFQVASVDGNTIKFTDDAVVVEESGFKSVAIYKSSGEIFSDFKEGDGVTISGCGEALKDNNRTFVIDKIVGNTLYAAADIFVEGEETGAVTISRTVPKLDYICEAENRLWGCNNSENTIYISALGDPTNMYAYEGLTTDSFATAVGSPGDFTGCCRYGSSVLFFKEDKIHKILGTCPADYTLYSYDVEGIQAGSDRSPVVINEVLYYKGIHGIYAYDGGIPTLISDCFGEKLFYEATAGTDGVSYYVSMRDAEDKWYLFAYNTQTGIWTLEDKDFRAKDAVRVGMDLYFLDNDGVLWKENAVKDVSESEWMLQFTPFYETIQGKKIYSRLLLRAEIPKGSYMVIEIRCDGGRWMELGKIVGKSDGVVPVRIPVNRCDKFEIRLRGKGEFLLREMLREYYVSSDK